MAGSSGSGDDHRPIAVIGAGIVGACAAAFLARDGHRVLLIDENGPGEGASFGNAGAISPDTCVPMALPGMLAKVPGWLRDPLGPLAVSPRYFPRALPWLLRWMRAGRMDRARTSAAALRALHAPAFEVYRDLLDAQTLGGLVRRTGQIYAWRGTPPTATERIADSLRDMHGVRTEPLSAEQLRQMEPAMAREFTRGLFFPDNGYTINPQRLVQSVAETALAQGGELRRAAVRGFARADGGRVDALVTDGGAVPVKAVVIAAGMGSRDLARRLGHRLPLEAERGYHAMLPRPGVAVRNKVSNRNAMFGITPMEHGLRLSGTVEIAGTEAPPNWDRAHVLVKHAKAMYPGLSDEGMTTWLGFRPSFPDSLPVIDRAPGLANVIYAFGHGHTGLTGGPLTGRLVAALIAGRGPEIDLAPYRATRF